jgi:hypothetical protein
MIWTGIDVVAAAHEDGDAAIALARPKQVPS